MDASTIYIVRYSHGLLAAKPRVKSNFMWQ